MCCRLMIILSVLFIDTEDSETSNLWYGWHRCSVSRWCLEDQPSEKITLMCSLMMIFTLHRHSQDSILGWARCAMKEFDILLRRCKSIRYKKSREWSSSQSSSHRCCFSRQTLTSLNLRLIKTESEVFQFLGDALKRNQVRECFFGRPIQLASFPFSSQTLKELRFSRILSIPDTKGAEHLAEGLKVNRVRQSLLSSMYLITSVTSKRHWPPFVFRALESTAKEPSICVRHWRSTAWDFSLSSTWRCHPHDIVDRHWPNWNWIGPISAVSVFSISVTPWKSTKCDEIVFDRLVL